MRMAALAQGARVPQLARDPWQGDRPEGQGSPGCVGHPDPQLPCHSSGISQSQVEQPSYKEPRSLQALPGAGRAWQPLGVNAARVLPPPWVIYQDGGSVVPWR